MSSRRFVKILLKARSDRFTYLPLGVTAHKQGSWLGRTLREGDVFATAIYYGMSVDALNDLDWNYTPPLGSPWDAVQLSAQAWAKVLRVV